MSRAKGKFVAQKLAVWVHYVAATAGEFLFDSLFDVMRGLAFRETGCDWAILDRSEAGYKIEYMHIYIYIYLFMDAGMRTSTHVEMRARLPAKPVVEPVPGR